MAGCPLCDGWDEDGFPEEYTLCAGHRRFMDWLDGFLEENRDTLGRLDDDTRLEFAESLLQMREGRGRTVRPGELRGGSEWIEYSREDLDELVAGEGDERGQGDV